MKFFIGIELLTLTFVFSAVMAQLQHDGGRQRQGTLQLEGFTKFVPQEWRPHIKGYAFRRYMQKLKLWWRITEENQHERIGPLIVSRLQGTPFTAAMSFSRTRDGVPYMGDEAMALPAPEAGPNAGADQPDIRHFLNQQKVFYELRNQDRVGIVSGAFFDCKRGRRQDLPTWIAAFELAF